MKKIFLLAGLVIMGVMVTNIAFASAIQFQEDCRKATQKLSNLPVDDDNGGDDYIKGSSEETKNYEDAELGERFPDEKNLIRQNPAPHYELGTICIAMFNKVRDINDVPCGCASYCEESKFGGGDNDTGQETESVWNTKSNVMGGTCYDFQQECLNYDKNASYR